MHLLAFLIAQAATLQAPPELLPSGPWQVEYAKSSCIVSRTFGDKPDVTLLAMKPAPNSDIVSLLIIQPSRKGRGVRGEADVRLSSGFVPEFAHYSSVIANGVRVTTIGVPRATLDQLAQGDAIAIKAGASVDVTLRPTAFDKAYAALRECEADLLESWGFSREAQAAVSQPPKGTLQGLIKVADYPDRFIVDNIQGSVGVRLRIAPDGSISECKAIEASGSNELDDHTCSLIRRRAKFAPALGHDGKPLWTFTFARVTWMLQQADEVGD